MPYRAVLFDLDGTLLDTLEDIANAANRVLAAHGFPTHSVAAYRYFVGEGVRTLIQRILPAANRDEATVAACVRDYREDYTEHWNVKTRPYPGVPEMLDGLVARGVRLAVLSNKPDVSTRQCVRELLPRWKFDVVFGQREGLAHKPDPAGAHEVARLMKLAPADFLYLGDTATDMQTAVAAGMYPVGALWGFRTAEELTRTGAKRLIARPEELVPVATGLA